MYLPATSTARDATGTSVAPPPDICTLTVILGATAGVPGTSGVNLPPKTSPARFECETVIDWLTLLPPLSLSDPAPAAPTAVSMSAEEDGLRCINIVPHEICRCALHCPSSPSEPQLLMGKGGGPGRNSPP